MGIYSTTETQACGGDGSSQLSVINSGFQAGPKVQFSGAVNLPSGCTITSEEQTITIDGESFGPYISLPTTITLTSGSNAGLVFDVTGTLEAPILNPQTGFSGSIPVQSIYSATGDNCGTDSASATVNINYQPPVPVIDVTDNGGGNFTFDGSSSSPVGCPGPVDYVWVLYEDGCLVPLPATDYTVNTGTLGTTGIGGGSAVIDVTFANAGTYCAELTCITECGEGTTNTDIDFQIDLIGGLRIDSADGNAVSVDVLGSLLGVMPIDSDPAYTYELKMIATDPVSGIDLGEIVRITGNGGAVGALDYSNSIIAAPDQPDITATFAGTTINGAGGIVWDDELLQDDVLNGVNTSGTCYADSQTEDTEIRWELCDLSDGTNTAVNIPINVLDPERCIVGYYAAPTSAESDTQAPAFNYVVDNAGNRIVQFTETANGCHAMDTLYEPPLGAFSNRVHNLITFTGPNGRNEIWFVERRFETGGSPVVESRLQRLVRNAVTCGKEEDKWDLETLNASQGDLSRTFLSAIDASVAQVNGVGVVFREEQGNNEHGIYWFDGTDWQYSVIDFPSLLGIGSSGTIYQMREDTATGWIYFSTGQSATDLNGAFRIKLNNPSTDDPRVLANWIMEPIISSKPSGSALGLGTVTEFGPGVHMGAYLDTTTLVNGEPRILFSDYGNHRIILGTRTAAAATGTAADWEFSLFAGGTSGFVDGLGTAAQFKLPYGMSERLNADGLILIGDEGNSAIRALDPITGAVTTVSPLPTNGLGDSIGDSIIH